MLLIVKKTLRLVTADEIDRLTAEQREGLMARRMTAGQVYLEGDTIEPTASEAQTLLQLFPDHFEPAH